MTRAELLRRIQPDHRLLLDASVLIAYLDGHEATSPIATVVLDELIGSGRNPAVISMVTVSELLVRPLRVGARQPFHHAHDFLTRFPHLSLADVDIRVAQEAASIRAAHRLTMPDALTVATGIVSQVSHLVTNDTAWRTRLAPLSTRISTVVLSAPTQRT
ncbi:MAG: PIN domain-containing protein [Chloroflexota bacterium]